MICLILLFLHQLFTINNNHLLLSKVLISYYSILAEQTEYYYIYAKTYQINKK